MAMPMERIAEERRRGARIKILGPVKDRPGYWWIEYLD